MFEEEDVSPSETAVGFATFEDKGPVEDDERFIKKCSKIVLNDYDNETSLGALFGACCSHMGHQSLEFRDVTVLDRGKGRYVKGRRLVEWCYNEEARLPFEVTNESIKMFVKYLIKYGYMTKATIASHHDKILKPIENGAPSLDDVVFMKEFYLWNHMQ